MTPPGAIETLERSGFRVPVLSDPQNLCEGRTRRAPYPRHRMVGEVTGFLHILRVDAPVDPAMGGRLRSRHVTVQGLDRLTAFLRQAHVPTPDIERAWRAPHDGSTRSLVWGSR